MDQISLKRCSKASRRVLLLVVLIEIRIARIKAPPDPDHVRQYHPISRHQIIEPGLWNVLIVRKDCQSRVVVRLPCESGGDGKSFLAVVIDLGAGSEANACQTVEEVAVRIDGTAKIETAFGTSISAGLQHDLPQLLSNRPLSDEIEEPPRRCLTIENRRRAVEQLYALQNTTYGYLILKQ